MISRFSKINKHLYRGSAPDENDLFTLKNKYNIERIISLDEMVAKDIAKICNHLGLEHLVIPLGDGNSSNVEYIKNNMDHIFDSNINTYIHCLHGKDRTSMVCAMYNIHKGETLQNVLQEAFLFGMGQGLSSTVKKSYYNTIINYFKNKDSNKASDAVSEQRQTLLQNPASPYIPSFAPYSDPNDTTSLTMNVAASSVIYTLSDGNDLLKPGKLWYTRKNIYNLLNNKKLYSAKISSNASVQKHSGIYNKTLLSIAKSNGFDVVFFTDGNIFILNPNALIDIKEEDFSDNNANAVVNVGQRTNYDGLAPYSFPGSGGLMESGYGGFAGPVQLPLTQFFE